MVMVASSWSRAASSVSTAKKTQQGWDVVASANLRHADLHHKDSRWWKESKVF